MNESAASFYRLHCKKCNDVEGPRKGLKIISCEGTCGDNYHIKCANLPDYAADLLVLAPKNMYFKCNTCLEKSSTLPDVFKILSSQNRVITDLTVKVNQLVDTISELNLKIRNHECDAESVYDTTGGLP